VFEDTVLRKIFGPRGDEVKDEMGGPCRTNGREEERLLFIGV
jgi:hypothetical protein